MKRNVSLEEISDGRLYGGNDMVKADCHRCEGCHACCTGMGNSVILDPYDAYRFQQGLEKGISQLFAEGMLELNVVDGIILPNLKMSGKGGECAFLNEEGRCGIHESRPGLCRLFPLGRYYEDGEFKYFLQIKECRASNRSKIKVSKWIDTPDQNRYYRFICDWHGLLNRLEKVVTEALFDSGGAGAGKTPETDSEAGTEAALETNRGSGRTEELSKSWEDSKLEEGKRLNVLLVKTFFLEHYMPEEDFYEQFAERMERYQANFSKG